MEWLFENPLLIIIIIGAIASALKRGKSEEEQRKNVPQRRPASEGKPLEEPGSMIFPRQEPNSRPIKSQASRAEKQFSEKRKQIENRMAVLKEQELELAEKAEHINKNVEHLQSERLVRRTDSKQSHSIGLDKESMVNGIILSEILGPPRAKQPHRSFSRR